MNKHHKQRRALVTGISGSGKSSLAFHLARDWQTAPSNAPVRWRFAFDPESEIADSLGWPVAISEPEIIRLASQMRPVSFNPIPSYGLDRLDEALERFCALVLAMARKCNGTKLLFIDEIWKYTGRTLPPTLKAIWNLSRKQEIDTLIVSQQLNETNATLRGQTTELWAFKQVDRRPLEWLEDEGFDSEQIQRLAWPGGFILKDKLRHEFRPGMTTRAGSPVFTPHKEPRINRGKAFQATT